VNQKYFNGSLIHKILCYLKNLEVLAEFKFVIINILPEGDGNALVEAENGFTAGPLSGVSWRSRRNMTTTH
jgi:hypothetical protein